MHYVFYPLVAVVCLAIGVLGGWIGRKRIGEAEIGSAEAKAQSIIDEAVKLGETKKKEALIEAKEEILQNKNETERELKERRAESMTRLLVLPVMRVSLIPSNAKSVVRYA